jgi:predicted nucleic acid-binding protein
MNRAVLDSSILIKSIFKPLRSLPKEAYAREMETHDKCRRLLKMIDEKDVEVYVPRACIVETAAVVRRLSDRARARKVSKGISESYEIAEELMLFDTAWVVATDTGCSGFDSYFIALAKIKKAVLFTDDNGMHHHARDVGAESILVRETDVERIEGFFGS